MSILSDRVERRYYLCNDGYILSSPNEMGYEDFKHDEGQEWIEITEDEFFWIFAKYKILKHEIFH